MRQLQLISDNIAKQSKEAKELKAIIKEAFTSSTYWKEKTEAINAIKAERKTIEEGIKEELAGDLNNLEVIENGIKNDMQIRNDHALVELQNTGKIEPIEIDGVKYAAEINVRFKKVI